MMGLEYGERVRRSGLATPESTVWGHMDAGWLPGKGHQHRSKKERESGRAGYKARYGQGGGGPTSSGILAFALRFTLFIKHMKLMKKGAEAKQGDQSNAARHKEGQGDSLAAICSLLWSSRSLRIFMNKINLAPSAGRQAKFSSSIFLSKRLSSPSEYCFVIEPILAILPPRGRLPIHLS